MTAKSAVMKIDTGENLFAKVKELITDLTTDVTNKLRSEASSGGNAVEDPFPK